MNARRWKDTEPVRLYLYSVGLAVVGLLVFRGVIAADEALLWAALLAAVLGVPAVELARSKVSPVARPFAGRFDQQHQGRA